MEEEAADGVKHIHPRLLVGLEKGMWPKGGVQKILPSPWSWRAGM
jgi:hypothetical protein